MDAKSNTKYSNQNIITENMDQLSFLGAFEDNYVKAGQLNNLLFAREMQREGEDPALFGLSFSG